MSDLLVLLRAHRRAAKKAEAAACALGEAVAAEAARTIGGVWHGNGEYGASSELGAAWFWIGLDADGVWHFGFGGDGWSTHPAEGADPRAAAYGWLRANTRYRQPEVVAAREWLGERGLHV